MIQDYFKNIDASVSACYDIATKARSCNLDPSSSVEIHLARNMAERVEGLIASIAPQILNSGITERISELEREYCAQDWRVALIIASEVAQEKFCKFKDKIEAMEMGIRVGFAYHTVGVVSAPLEGFIGLVVKKTRDNKEYLAAKYAGPVRGAGGTAAAVSVLIVDFVAKTFGYAPYDPSEEEIERFLTEIYDYHERVVNLQYKPSVEELKFLVAHLPIEVDGEPTEKIEVSNYKDMSRIETNRIRGGVCLVVSMIALKAPKLLKELQKWSTDLKLDWSFMDKFIQIQKKAKAQSSGDSKEKSKGLSPDYTFIADLPAGRPVLGYPLRKGGFRLRYGRTRFSGYSAASIHPATMHVLNDFIAVGTQLKLERPGKATAVTVCDSIEGPIVKLLSGSVVQFQSAEIAKKFSSQVSEILFLGDMLVSFGDFLDRNHVLAPVGYCEEQWFQELKSALESRQETLDDFCARLNISVDELLVLKHTFEVFDPNLAFQVSKELGIPIHPRMLFWWSCLEPDDMKIFFGSLSSAKIEVDESSKAKKIIIRSNSEIKKVFEKARIPHEFHMNEFIILRKEIAAIIDFLFLNSPSGKTLEAISQDFASSVSPDVSILDALATATKADIRDKTGTFIGARMGRPEKSKMRRMTGRPHGLFPVGKDGGRFRTIQSALASGKVTSDFRLYHCPKCNAESIYPSCIKCRSKCNHAFYCQDCAKIIHSTECFIHGPAQSFRKMNLNIKEYFQDALDQLKLSSYPDIIKGVKGTSSKDHDTEHIIKAILRAKHDIHVNKDGTIRYDMTELPLTHFTPEEIGTSVNKLKSLGYTIDVNGNPLSASDQVVELLPQDVILPVNPNSPDQADRVMINSACFVDDLLQFMYGLPRYYNISSPEDLIGHLVIGIAPHISAGIIGRIIGFSKTQGCIAHPLWHAAHRRDCDGDENCVMLLLDGLINFSKHYLPDKRGSRTMDAPLVLTSVLVPSEVDDMVHRLDIPDHYPLELYEKSADFSAPYSVDISLLGHFLDTDKQYEGIKYTNPVSNINHGVLCSSYKTLPTMEDKLKSQMSLAEKLHSVTPADVAGLVIDKHFMKDIVGNLRQFSMQKFRCLNCNAKFRRPPLIGRCTHCDGKLLFTVSEGTVIKYLQPSIDLAKKYNLPDYTTQRLEIIRDRIESIFGRTPDKQQDLAHWF